MKDNIEKIKVLQINASIKGFGGVSEIIFNIYKKIDKSKVQFDFLSPNKTTYELHREEIEKMDGNLYGLDINKNKLFNKILLFVRLKRFLKQKEYDIIHINSGSFFFNLEVAIVAKISGSKRIVIHSHNTLNQNEKLKRFLVKIFKPIMDYIATDFLACSKDAACDMFSRKTVENKVVILQNGIELEKFKYQEQIRNNIREQLDIEDKVVIGNVGRLVKQKNQEFLIETFKHINEKNPNTVLIIIGEGELESKLKEKAKELNLSKKIFFLGLKKNVNEFMQAMDIFVLPSLYEGFGIVGLEAQTAGLYTVVSSKVPYELSITPNIKYLDLELGPEKWADEILQINNINIDRELAYNEVSKTEYNIENTAEKLLYIYING